MSTKQSPGRAIVATDGQSAVWTKAEVKLAP